MISYIFYIVISINTFLKIFFSNSETHSEFDAYENKEIIIPSTVLSFRTIMYFTALSLFWPSYYILLFISTQGSIFRRISYCRKYGLDVLYIVIDDRLLFISASIAIMYYLPILRYLVIFTSIPAILAMPIF